MPDVILYQVVNPAEQLLCFTQTDMTGATRDGHEAAARCTGDLYGGLFPVTLESRIVSKRTLDNELTTSASLAKPKGSLCVKFLTA